MNGNRWDQPGVPHKGWHCVDVVDLRADGEPADETDYATCQMCGNEKIRYVHIMEHPDLDENFEVGCVCAEKMSGDYEGPKRREAKLRNRAVRRTRWLQRKWRVAEHAAHTAPQERARYHFDYARLRADLNRVRAGLQDYLVPQRAQPRDPVPLAGDYVRRDRADDDEEPSP